MCKFLHWKVPSSIVVPVNCMSISMFATPFAFRFHLADSVAIKMGLDYDESLPKHRDTTPPSPLSWNLISPPSLDTLSTRHATPRQLLYLPSLSNVLMALMLHPIHSCVCLYCFSLLLSAVFSSVFALCVCSFGYIETLPAHRLRMFSVKVLLVMLNVLQPPGDSANLPQGMMARIYIDAIIMLLCDEPNDDA